MTGEISGMIDVEMLGLLWQTQSGTELTIRLTGLSIIVIGIFSRGIGVWLAVFGALISLWSFSRIGHVASTDSAWLQYVLLVHLCGASFWIGILYPLHSLAGKPCSLRQATVLGQKFGTVAAFIVPILIIAGVLMVWNLLDEFSALINTNYGLTLLGKIAAVALLLSVAAFNKLRYIPAMRAGVSEASVSLRRSISIEWTTVAIILMLTAVLTTVTGLDSGGGH